MNNAINVRIIGDEYKDESIANAAISPGDLIEIMDNSGVENVRKHSTDGGVAEPFVAAIDDLQGKDKNDAYKANDRCFYYIGRPGDRFLMRLANGENAVIGADLASNGDGSLKVSSTNRIAIAKEAVDMSDSSGADPDGFIIAELV